MINILFSEMDSYISTFPQMFFIMCVVCAVAIAAIFFVLVLRTGDPISNFKVTCPKCGNYTVGRRRDSHMLFDYCPVCGSKLEKRGDP